MKRLFIGCGAADAIYYNPFYTGGPTAHAPDYAANSKSAEAVRKGQIVVQRLCSHTADGDVTVDFNAVKCPSIVGDVTNPDLNAELDAYGAGYFDGVQIENVPFGVLTSNNASAFFRTLHHVTAAGGSLRVTTGTSGAEAVPAIIGHIKAAGYGGVQHEQGDRITIWGSR